MTDQRPHPGAFAGEAEAYDRWYEAHPHAWQAELAALRELATHGGRGLAVGVGTGRFAGPLDVAYGVEPAISMARLARERGVPVVQGVGEALAFADDSFQRVLMVAVFAYLSDPEQALREARRVLVADGQLLVGLLDRSSPLWPQACGRRADEARFRTAVEAAGLLARAGFRLEAARQTIFEPLAEIDEQPAVREGAGEGLFAALAARPRGETG